ncbi:hypothetical protein C5B86_11765 [Haloferax sp. Atlit-19N]|uniref:DUF6498-containing protein n=1 Tax=Haloferax TaxID=2251 RepID=UPI000678D37F|nr:MULTISPECIES: DUF6498-containing protein [Haloferax]RDZ43705.1 hypothetical protein C5B86_11765 [Haloferax sp. Atlit-19N]
MTEHRRRTGRRTLAGLTVANALPLVGILLFDWRLVNLLVVYWVEIAGGALRRMLEATFAGQRGAAENWVAADSRWGWRSPFRSLREKRGSVHLHASLPPLYPRSFPRVFELGRVVIGLSLVSGGGLWFATVGSGMFVESLLVAGVTTLAREAATLVRHVKSRDYRDLVPLSVLTPRSTLGVIVLAGVVVWGVAFGPSPTERTGFLFVLVYLARVGFDAYSVVENRNRFAPRDPTEADFEAADDDEWAPIGIPDGAPRDVYHTNRRAVWGSAVVDGLFGVLSPRRFATVAIAAFLGYVLAGATWAAVGASAVVMGVVAHTLAERDLRWGHLEYRMYENHVVCHDCLLDTTQWRIERRLVADVTERSRLVERLLGASSATIAQHGDSPARTLRCLGSDAFAPPSETITADWSN